MYINYNVDDNAIIIIAIIIHISAFVAFPSYINLYNTCLLYTLVLVLFLLLSLSLSLSFFQARSINSNLNTENKREYNNVNEFSLT